MTVKLLSLFIFAFILRLIALNQSLWLDEAVSANVAKNYSYTQILTKFSPHDFHPPFYYFLLKSWSSIFSYSAISLRFPSLLTSLLTGYFVFLIGRQLKNSSLGFWAALFFLFNPLIIYYSQEARMYSLVTLFLTISLYFFLILIQKSNFINYKSVIIFNFFVFLSFLTFYGSVFFLVTLYLYLLLIKRYRLLLLALPGFIIALLLIFPLLRQQLLYSHYALQNVTNWSLVLGRSSLKNLLLIPLKFSVGHLSFYPKIIYYLISIPWTIFLGLLILKSANNNKSLFYILLFPLFLAFIISFNSPMLDYFRYLYLIPIFSLLLALSTQSLKLTSLLAFTFLTFSLIYLLFPIFHREDWQSLAQSLPQNTTLYLIPAFSDPLKYYRPDLTLKDLRQPPTSFTLTLVPYGVAIYGYDYQSKLSLQGYKNISTTNFRQLTLENWSR